jgi:hypothetical protein
MKKTVIKVEISPAVVKKKKPPKNTPKSRTAFASRRGE